MSELSELTHPLFALWVITFFNRRFAGNRVLRKFLGEIDYVLPLDPHAVLAATILAFDSDSKPAEIVVWVRAEIIRERNAAGDAPYIVREVECLQWVDIDRFGWKADSRLKSCQHLLSGAGCHTRSSVLGRRPI